MNAIKYACSLNNHGVNLLVSGESATAIKACQSALCLLKKASFNQAETTSSTEMKISACDDASLPFCESTSTVSGLQGLHGYVYDHGIMIPGNMVNGEAETEVMIYIAIVLFNLALASHWEGTATALGRDKLLLKASVLYSLVVQLLNRKIMPEDASTNILTLLALNNKAQIHYDQCEYVQSVDCMKNISKIMDSSSGLHSTLSHLDIWGLLLNVMFLSTPTAARAA
jgi:hypothetical protein